MEKVQRKSIKERGKQNEGQRTDYGIFFMSGAGQPSGSLFLAAVEIVGFYRNKACVSQAAKGASEHIKADYQAALFENYHLLLLDKDYKGLGEGGIEDALMQYLEYTLSPQGFTIHDAGLTNTNPVLENHCEELKSR